MLRFLSRFDLELGLLKRILWIIIGVSLIPAFILVVQRVQSEGSSQRVTLLLDEPALNQQARILGTDVFSLGEEYRQLGISGIALYEERLSGLSNDGDILVQFGSDLLMRAAEQGDAILRDVETFSTLVSPVTPNVLDDALRKNNPPAEAVRYLDRTWFIYPGNSLNRAAGPNRAEIARWHAAGWDIAYRPLNHINLNSVGQDFPPEANYLIHQGTQIAGHPLLLDNLKAASQNYITALIENTTQLGMEDIVDEIPTARLLSFNQAHINLRLSPDDLVNKFMLAVNERGVRMLYLRPYTTTHQGDTLANTKEFLGGLVQALEREGYTVAPLNTLQIDYESNTLLRSLSALGVVAALLLLAFLYPSFWGWLMAGGVLLVGIFFGGGLNWDALALIAALSFPVIGYGYLSERLSSIGFATMISLAGAMLLTAVGSDREAMLAIEPFAGVGATLFFPPLLYIAHVALKHRMPLTWVRDFWGYRIRLGDVVLVAIAAFAFALVVLRRGNFPVIDTTELEVTLREWLSSFFARPRFKELIGHPMAVLGLSQDGWPIWVRTGLMTGGVIAQATILNSFSHYHTPVLVSLERTIVALVLGLLIGFAIIPASRYGVRVVRGWLGFEGEKDSSSQTQVLSNVD